MSGQEKVQKKSKSKKQNLILPEQQNDNLSSQAESVFLDENVKDEKNVKGKQNKNLKKDNKQFALVDKKERLDESVVENSSEKTESKEKSETFDTSNLSDEEKKERERIDEQKRKLDEAEQSVAKQNSKKKKLLNLGFLILNICIVAGILVYQLNGQKIELVHGLKLNGWAILLLFIFFGVTLFLDTFTISYLLRISTGKWRMGISYKVFAIGKYYDNITPLATGGQPFQITYLKNRGVPLHTRE